MQSKRYTEREWLQDKYAELGTMAAIGKVCGGSITTIKQHIILIVNKI